MKAIFAAVILALVLVAPVSAIDFPWYGHQDIAFWNAASDIAGYRVINHMPEPAVQASITSVAITSTSGEQTLGTWLTSPFPETTTIAPGRWIFRTYAVSSSDSGITRMHFRIFNRTETGTITYLFFGNAITQDINRGITPSEYDTFYARRNITTLFPGDRLGIQINVSTDSAAARTVTMEVGGNTNASYVSTGYWLGDTSGGSSSTFGPGDNVVLNQSLAHDPTRGESVPWDLWVASGIIGLLLIVLALARPKTNRMDYEVNIVLSVLSWPFCWYFAWGGITSVDYIVGAGSAASSNLTAMITQHIIYNFWLLGIIGVAGSIFAVFITSLLASQYKLFSDNEANAAAALQQDRQQGNP